MFSSPKFLNERFASFIPPEFRTIWYVTSLLCENTDIISSVTVHTLIEAMTSQCALKEIFASVSFYNQVYTGLWLVGTWFLKYVFI